MVGVVYRKMESVRFLQDPSDPDDGEILIQDTEEEESQADKKSTLSSDETPGITCYLISVVSFAVIGGFLFGYDTGVISGALLVLDRDFDFMLTTIQKELLVSITIAAAALGAIFGGPCNEIFGRKPTIMISSVIFSVGAILMAAGPINTLGFILILLGRFIVGVGIGLASMTVPMYLAECSPTRLRGRLTVLDNMAVTGGQFVAGVVDFSFSYIPQGWRYMLGVAALPSIVRFIAFFFLCESPRWLLGKGKRAKAKQSLRKLRGPIVADESIEQELEDIHQNINETSEQNKTNFVHKLWLMVSNKHLLLSLIVGCGLQAIQQLSGINTVMYYSPTILKMAGATDDHVAIGLGALIAFGNFSLTLVGLYFIERAGRRKLILGSLTGVIISLLVLALAFFFTNSTSQVACPTSKCLPNTCDDCVIEDDCFYCLFPSNSTYGSSQSLGYCVHRSSTIHDSCVVARDELLTSIELNSSCYDNSYVTDNYTSHLNSSQYQGSTLSSCPNKFSWLAMTALVMYIVSFAPGMGPVPWTINAEIYPNWSRSIGNSASATTNWTFNLLVSLTFLHLTKYLTRYGAFVFYMFLAIGGWLFIFLLLPETKGRTLEQVEECFRGKLCPPPGITHQHNNDKRRFKWFLF